MSTIVLLLRLAALAAHPAPQPSTQTVVYLDLSGPPDADESPFPAISAKGRL